MRASAHTGVALSKDSLRSQSVFLLVCTEIGIVIASQSADWCGNPSPPAFPHGEGARRSGRMRATCLSLWERCPRKGAERANFTLSVGFAASSPRGGAKGGRRERTATPACALVRNDMHNLTLSAKSIPSSARWSIEYTSAEHALRQCQPCPACFSSSGMKSRTISLSRVRS